MSSFANATSILKKAIEARVFPGAAFGILRPDGTVSVQAVGNFRYEAESPSVAPDTGYDLASVTKVLGTTAIAMRMHQQGVLDLETPLVELLPQFGGSDPGRRRVTLGMLLAHTSGLPAYERLWLLPSVLQETTAVGRQERAWQACLQMPLVHAPGTVAEYSDLGFLLLGLALSRLANQPLDALAQEIVFRPLGMAATGYLPSPEACTQIAPTCDWNMRHCVLQGQVHDENCALLGGVTGHTGIFSNCADVLAFARAVLQADGFFLPQTVATFSQPILGSRALGWDTPSQPSQSGRYFSAHSIGHLGYSGTSLWIDLDRKLAVTLLTNRCYTGPDAAPMEQKDAISLVRPNFHNAVMEELLGH